MRKESCHAVTCIPVWPSHAVTALTYPPRRRATPRVQAASIAVA